MSGASIETTLELWASSLRDVKRRMRPLFTQARMALSAENFLEGLLGEERRKTGWMRAEAAGDPGPWRQQAILGRGRWDADALRDIVRDYAHETLADDDAVLVIDETGFLRRGRRPAASRGNIRVRRARSPTVRSASSPAMSRRAVTPSSTANYICPKAGRTIRRAWPRRMSRERSSTAPRAALRPSRRWRAP
jgi:DDE superfamily endonuclease